MSGSVNVNVDAGPSLYIASVVIVCSTTHHNQPGHMKQRANRGRKWVIQNEIYCCVNATQLVPVLPTYCVRVACTLFNVLSNDNSMRS
jgi:hypothetical protein